VDQERERRLADALADLLDARAGQVSSRRVDPSTPGLPELAPELAALDEIDRVLDPEAALPDRLSGHRVVEEIGSGGMGRVLLAVDEALGRKVAIKTLSPRYENRPALRNRFMAEARAMARLNHPNIARIYSLGPSGEPAHFVMEYVEGAPLTKASASLSFEQKAELLLEVAVAVQFLHGQGIVHRDLKPANILVSADLRPKLLDFGLALDLGQPERASVIGEIAGTPEYLSPEQAAGVRDLDPRTDVFSLGAVLYELLTGQPPFGGKTVSDLIGSIREDDPVLPRRRVPTVPRDLQSICLKALEKDPTLRYASAGEMADDLRRFLAHDAVLADPPTYARMITGNVAQHMRDLETWRHDQIVSEAEYDAIRKRYERLIDREDAWIMEARRLTISQVTLYLGAWILAVGAAFLTCFRYPALAGAPAVLIAWSLTAALAWIGIRTWRRDHHRIAVAYLLTLGLVAVTSVLVTLEEAHLFAGITKGQIGLELSHRLQFSKEATNAQLWWSILAGLPVCLWMRRFTRAPVFSLMLAAMTAVFSLATLLRMGMIDWLDNDPGRFYFHLIPCALVFMVAGLILEQRGLKDDSRYFYPFGVVFAWAALSGVAAFHAPYSNWLKSVAPWTRGQLEYLFIINAGIYFALDRVCDWTRWAQMRVVGKAFRFVIPGHVMTSLLLLGLSAQYEQEARIFEWLLPATACVFVFGSIPRQMKNFFASGLLFFAIGGYRLQQQVFRDRAIWPAFLVATGLALMITAANYAPLKVRLAKLVKFRRR
jgi:predicted Ser/Thr protein kinase